MANNRSSRSRSRSRSKSPKVPSEKKSQRKKIFGFAFRCKAKTPIQSKMPAQDKASRVLGVPGLASPAKRQESTWLEGDSDEENEPLLRRPPGILGKQPDTAQSPSKREDEKAKGILGLSPFRKNSPNESPLQQVENRLLDVTEARMARPGFPNTSDPNFDLYCDPDIIPDPKMIPRDSSPPPRQRSLASIRSSVDTDEEPQVFTATAVTIKRIGPRMVRPVQFPHRNSCTIGLALTTNGRDASRQYSDPFDLETEAPSQSTSQQGRLDTRLCQASGGSTRMQRHQESADQHTSSLRGGDGAAKDLEPFPSFRDGYTGRFSTPKKEERPASETERLVTSWLEDMSAVAPERPVSNILDPVIVPYRQIAPRPLQERQLQQQPLDITNKIPRHHCIRVGHRFCLIDLEKIPDEASIGRLAAHPYFHSATGRKEHVFIPVMCDKCSGSTRHSFWQCRVPACRTAICWDCAREYNQKDHELPPSFTVDGQRVVYDIRYLEGA